MINRVLLALALIFVWVGSVSAQTIGGSATLSVTTASANIQFPADLTKYPAVAIWPESGSTQETFFAIGGSSVAAVVPTGTPPVGSPSLFPGGICFQGTHQNQYVAAIVAANTATLRIAQFTSCPPGIGFAGGGGGGGGGGGNVSVISPLDGSGNVNVDCAIGCTGGGFTQTQTFTPIAVTTGGNSTTVSTGSPAVIVATNIGTNTAYCAPGASATTSSQPVTPNGGTFPWARGSATQLTCITSASTTTVNVTGGSGSVVNTGGGGVNTVAVTQSTSPWVVALNTTPSLANGSGVVPTQGGSVLGVTNGGYTNNLQGNAVLSATNGLYTNVLQGNAALTNANPIFSALSIAGAAVSATNGEYVNNLQGNAVLSATNGMYTNILQGNAVLATGNPLFAQLTTGAAAIGSITNTGFNVLQGGAALSTANPSIFRLVDSTSDAATITAGGNLNVQCANCSGSGVSTADGAAFAAGSSLFAGTGGAYQTTVTSNPLTAGNQGMAQLTHYRALMTDWYNSSGTEMGTTGSPVQVGAPSGAFASGSFASGALASGSVASGAIATGALAAGSISSGAAVSGAFATGAITDLALAQGSTTSGQVGNLVYGAAVTAAPTTTTGGSYPLSLTTKGSLRTDLNSVSGTNIVVNAGAVTAGALRIAVGQDTTTIAGSAPGTAGTASTNVLTVQGVASMTPVQVSQATASNLNAQIVGAGAAGSALTGNPVLIAGSDATNARTLSTDTSGHLIIEPGNTANTTPWLATARVVGNAGGVMDLSAAGASAAASALQVAGIYNSTPLTLTNGQGASHQLDASGYLEVDVKAGSAGNAAASATGSAVPAQADYSGINVAGTLRGATGVNPTGSVYATQIDEASLGGTSLAAATAWGTAPSGNVLNSNVNIQGCLSTICPSLGQAAAAASSPVVGATGTIAGGTTGTAGTPSATVVSIQGISGGTGINVASTSAITDRAAFAYGTTAYTPIGGVFNNAITNLTSGQGGALALTNDRNAFVNLNKVGGSAIALNQTTMSASLPVTIASDQTPVPAALNSTPSLANGNGVVLYQGGALSSSNGIYTNILQGNAALSGSNALPTGLVSVSGTALSGATSAYGSAPTGTTVMGVNAYVTNANANVGDNTDSVAPNAAYGSPTVNHNYIYDGTNWDRMNGDPTHNLLAAPGVNTGSFAAWTSSVSTTRTISTVNGAPAAALQFDLTTCTGSPTGAITINVSYDGGATWQAANNNQVIFSGSYAPVANPYTINWAATNPIDIMVLLHGATGLQLVLSSAISGTGTCSATPYYAMLPVLPQQGAIGTITSAVPSQAMYVGASVAGNIRGETGTLFTGGANNVNALATDKASVGGTAIGTSNGGVSNVSALGTIAASTPAVENVNAYIVGGAGSGGTSAADASAWTAGTTNMTIGGCEFTTGGATAIVTAHAGAVGCTAARAQLTDLSSEAGTAITNVPTAVGTAGTGNTPTFNAYNVGPFGSAASAASMPVVIATDQVAVATKAASGTFVAGSIADLAHGQATMANSVPVVFASNQSAISIKTNDPCVAGAKTNVSIATSAGTTQLVAPSGSTQVYICSEVIVGATAWVGNLVGGTGASCTTGTPVALQGSTTAASGMSFAANGGFTFGGGGATVTQTTTAGHGVCLIQSGTAALAGNITYIQQ